MEPPLEYSHMNGDTRGKSAEREKVHGHNLLIHGSQDEFVFSLPGDCSALFTSGTSPLITFSAISVVKVLQNQLKVIGVVIILQSLLKKVLLQIINQRRVQLKSQKC